MSESHVSNIAHKTSARELNSFLNVQATIEKIELGSWKELPEEYMKFKKFKNGENGKWPPQNVYPEFTSVDFLKQDPLHTKSFLFDLSKMIWWHMPALYADYGCLVRHLVTEIRAFAGQDKLTQYNGDLTEGWKSLRFCWTIPKKNTMDINEDNYAKYISVFMNASDCMHYLILKANRPDFRDCRDVLVRVKEETEKEQRQLFEKKNDKTLSMCVDQIVNLITLEEEVLKDIVDVPCRKKQRLLENKIHRAGLMVMGNLAQTIDGLKQRNT